MNKVLVVLVFSTNRTDALDLYLVFMSRTHFKQSMGKLVDSSNFYKCSEPIKPKSKLKTKTGLAEDGDITNRGIITRIFVFRTNRGINELHKEKSSSKDL